MGGRVEGEVETKATGRAMNENESWKCVCAPELEVDFCTAAPQPASFPLSEAWS